MKAYVLIFSPVGFLHILHHNSFTKETSPVEFSDSFTLVVISHICLYV